MTNQPVMNSSQGSLSSATPELTDQCGRRRLSRTTPNPESPQLNGNETHAAESEKATLTKAEPRPSSPLWEWTVEILWLVLSIPRVVSLVVMIILLSFEDGKTWESWNFYLSLNTVVSIFGTISRISLASAVGSCLAQEKWNWYRKRQNHLFIFDRINNASRSSLGSFKLLFWMKFQ